MGVGDILIGFSRAPTATGWPVLTDVACSLGVGAGGGKAVVTLTDSQAVSVGSGGGKRTVTLTDGNPSVVIT